MLRAAETRPATPAPRGGNDHGIVFAAGADGRRSSTEACRQILGAALRVTDPALAAALGAERHWRRRYPHYLRRLVHDGLADGAAAIAAARAGLAAARQALAWQPADGGAPQSLGLAMAPPHPAGFDSIEVQGSSGAPPAPWRVPLRGEWLAGERLLAQIADWQRRGIVEAGAARALARCVAHPEWFDLSDRRLVLLGAASEAGPLSWLMRWRAQVLAIDIDQPSRWQHLEALARAGNGRLCVPVRRGGAGGATPGADLLRDTPQLAAWLLAQAGSDALDIAALAYLDGERHLRVVLAMDLLQAACCTADTRCSLAFLATPSDVFAVPRPLADAARTGFESRPASRRIAQRALGLFTGRRYFQSPVVPGPRPEPEGHGVVDALVLQQGPNYALAKRLQQWRALVARADGHRVSINVAPSTTTASVLKNPALAAGFAGAGLFGVEAFAPETTHALMAALWVHDLRCPQSPADPARALAHPLDALAEQACHGGLWRCPYLPRSALPFAAAWGWWRQRHDRPTRAHAAPSIPPQE